MKRGRIILLFFFLLLIWIVSDVDYPYKTDIRKFDAGEVARLDGAMWRSYYERKKIRLFRQSAELMRKQFHVPFWRSHIMAYHAAKAAILFQKGRSRADYEKALPDLSSYYWHISNISLVPFDIDRAARQELEWWIIRRYRNEHPPAEWEKYLTLNAETVYGQPAEKFIPYAHERVEAMLLRDSKGEAITEADWQQINRILNKAWSSLSDTLHF